jgi:glycosyltransferase involved in cell wall biosynthesis
MRVVLANKFLYPKGGAERAVLTLGAELVRRGHTVHYFGMQHPDNAVQGDDVELVGFRDYHRGGRAAWSDALAMIYSFEARRRFAHLLDRARPDVVHAHNIYHQLTPSILDAARTRGIPVVMTLHDYKLVCPRYDMLRQGRPCDACVDTGPVACLRYRCVRDSWGASLLLTAESLLHRARGSYDAVHLWIAPSRFLRAVLLRAGFDSSRIRVLPNFAPPVGPGAGDRRMDRFVYAGRLAPEKGIETLVHATRALARGQLLVCGDGPLTPRIAELATQAPADRIVLRGHLEAEELAETMRSAAFSVVPSEWFENAPFAVLEAMALGRAVLASNIGGLPELVIPGETGDLVPPGDVGAWTAALSAALDDPARIRHLGETAARVATSRFALDAHVDAIERLYREVAA